MKKPIVINFFAGAGSGKSTGSAYIFSKLKMLGINCELVTEYAKDKTWEKSTKVFDNQAYIFGKQYYRLTRLHNEIDVAITDSPLLLSIVYNNSPILKDNFNKVVLDVFNSYQNINFFINRTKHYNQAGRWQTFEEAKEIDKVVLDLLNKNGVVYDIIDGNIEGYDKAVETIVSLLNLNKVGD